jgi:hypothetical protein
VFDDPTTPTEPNLGKNSKQQNLVSPHAGTRSSLATGDHMSRAMGQYGKGHTFNPLRQIRGGMGGMQRVRGGLGSGKKGQAGNSPAYKSTIVGDDKQ